MKPPTNRTFAFFACAGLFLALVVGAANQERIRWIWCDHPFHDMTIAASHGHLELGLRNDGMVVWREIKPATTNSPAEREDAGLLVMTNWIGTNTLMTNWYTFTNIIIRDGNTNGTIEPLWRNNGKQQFLHPQ